MNLKEKLRQKREKKAEKRQTREIKRQTTQKVKVKSHVVSVLGKSAAQARERLLFDDKSKPLSQDILEQQILLNNKHLTNIIYGRDLPQAYVHMDYIIGFSNILGHFLTACGYDSSHFLHFVDKADAELKTHNGTWRMHSPNENRRKLVWVTDLLNLLHTYLTIVSERVVGTLQAYNVGILISIYHKRLLSNENLNLVTALLRITQGASFRQQAQSLNMKETELKPKILSLAESLYHMADRVEECAGITHAKSIPDLRSPPYAWIGNWQNMKQTANHARHNMCSVFEKTYGLCFYDWRKYDQVVKMAEFKLNKVFGV